MDTPQIKHTDDKMLISYQLLRKIIGWLGIVLPLILVIYTFVFFKCQTIEGSISDYYHTEARNIFVGVLCAVAFFMFTYRGYDNRDRIAGNLACIFALGVAFFPTTIDSESNCLTTGISECSYYNDILVYPKWVSYVHFISAALFFGVLSYFSLVLFRASSHDKNNMPEQKLKRNKIYFCCGLVMIFCVLVIALYHFYLKDKFPELKQLDIVFWFEWIALWAFGISWLTKGEMILKDK